MKNSIRARSEFIAVTWNTSANAYHEMQTPMSDTHEFSLHRLDVPNSKSASDLAADPSRLSWMPARFLAWRKGNAPYLLILLRATFIQPFMQIVHRLTVWCDTYEPNAAYRLGAWELHASDLARELVERNQAAANDRKVQKALCLQAERPRCSEQNCERERE